MESLDQAPGILLILTGSTASGKDTVVRKLLQRFPDFSKITTTTSRLPRKDEKEGKDYYFVSRERFLERLQAGEFLETVEYSGNYYGTTKAEIRKVLNGKNMIWRIEATMASRAKDYFKAIFDPNSAAKLLEKTLVVFLTTPNKQTLVRRLTSRGMDEKAIQIRFKQDAENWDKLKDKFENVIVNKDGALDETINQIAQLLTKKIN